MNRIVTYMMFAIFVFGQTNTQAANEESQAVILSYIDTYQEIAVAEMLRTGIPASIKLAQAILESNAGRSHLAVHGNNHFGIKCGKYWSGKTVMREDDDYNNGKLIKSCFRAFPTSRISFKAHSEFLMDPKKHYRYGSLFELNPTDYKAWAKGLKKAGYATNPKYPTRLISIIERYQLYQYDHPPVAHVQEKVSQPDKVVYQKTEVKQSAPNEISPAQTVTEVAVVESPPAEVTKSAPKTDAFFAGVSTSYVIHVNNDVEYINTSYGDKLESIALETGKTVESLLCYNDNIYSAHESLPADIKVYITAKKNKYGGSRNTYRMSKGETIFEVAQKFGIKLSKLAKRNKWAEHYQAKGGELAYLKGKKK